MALVTLKRGDSFSFTAKFTDASGVVMTGIADSLRCQIRDKVDTLIDELIITETDTPGKYLFKSLGTTQYPIRTLYFDIQYNDLITGIITSTPMYEISVRRDITHE